MTLLHKWSLLIKLFSQRLIIVVDFFFFHQLFCISQQANPSTFDRCEDLSHLRFLNESSTLHTLRQRYGSNLIHTYAGNAMVVLNPTTPLAIYSEKVSWNYSTFNLNWTMKTIDNLIPMFFRTQFSLVML